MCDISKALTIDGWMNEDELRWLAEEASEHDSIIELGCLLGRSTRALGDHTKGEVIAIDDWYGPREIFVPDEVRASLYNQFLDNMSDLIIKGKVRPLRVSHRDEVSLAKVRDADMVFIDGDHNYQAVKEDILFWQKKVVKGGLLCGHDARDISVSQAVIELLESPGIVPNTDIWVQYV